MPRDFAEGTELTFTEGKNTVYINETAPASGVWPDHFRPSDTWKGIVDRDTNQIVAYIERVVHATSFIVKLI